MLVHGAASSLHYCNLAISSFYAHKSNDALLERIFIHLHFDWRNVLYATLHMPAYAERHSTRITTSAPTIIAIH
jgi:hypothetical protein